MFSINLFGFFIILFSILNNIVVAEDNSNTDNSISQFIGLSNDRLILAYNVALYKKINHQNITDKVREEQLLKNITGQAENLSLKSDYVKQIFQDQIDANKNIQNFYVDLWNKTSIPQVKVLDLNNDIRPKIDKINNNILQCLVKIQKISSTENCLNKIKKYYNYFIQRSNQIEEFNKALNITVTHLCNNFNKTATKKC